jgi:pimeloyl-ACP methyl ester carboxylesterase
VTDTVLVHGGFHGGWCWDRVRGPLADRGWNVFTPSLTGCGDRVHLASATVGAATHVTDIVNLIDAEELEQVVLCGHSAGGHVISGVAETIPERIAHLVYLDAVVPRSGESVHDVIGEAEGVPQLFRDLTERGDGISIAPESHDAAAFGVDDPADVAWLERRLTSHPLRCFEEPVELGSGYESVTSKTFVRCGFQAAFAEPQTARLEADPAWRVLRWDVGHDAMIISPDAVVDLLLETADG